MLCFNKLTGEHSTKNALNKKNSFCGSIYQRSIQCQSCDIGHNHLYCGKWRQILCLSGFVM